MKKIIKKINVVVFALLIITFFMNHVSSVNYNDIYNAPNNNIHEAGKIISGIIKGVGVTVCVIVLMIKGIKFIVASPEGKADAKKELIPWTVGTVLLFCITTFVQFIIDFAQNHINTL